MCSSFLSRKGDTIVAMNFDNNGMKFSLDQKHPGWFAIQVDAGRGRYPSFGVDREGRFFNNLMVESNGKGLYRRPSVKVTHTSKLVSDILEGVIQPEHLGEYLARIEVVNTPDWSCHNLICDSAANAWIVEPGRGNIHFPEDATPFVIMANVSVVDGCTSPRTDTTIRMLNESREVTVERAFEILAAVAQTEGEWITDFSMVYSKAKKEVYYCSRHDFTSISKYQF